MSAKETPKKSPAKRKTVVAKKKRPAQPLTQEQRAKMKANPVTKTTTYIPKQEGRHPRTGVPVDVYLQDPLNGLSKDQKRILRAIKEQGIMNVREVADFILDGTYADLEPAKQKQQRNTTRKTMEALEARGLIRIEDTPNVTEKRHRSGEVTRGVFGTIKAYRLAPKASSLIDKMAS